MSGLSRHGARVELSRPVLTHVAFVKDVRSTRGGCGREYFQRSLFLPRQGTAMCEHLWDMSNKGDVKLHTLFGPFTVDLHSTPFGPVCPSPVYSHRTLQTQWRNVGYVSEILTYPRTALIL